MAMSLASRVLPYSELKRAEDWAKGLGLLAVLGSEVSTDMKCDLRATLGIIWMVG